LCREYSRDLEWWRAIPKRDQIKMIADHQLRAEEMRKANKPKPRGPRTVGR
jgi:hypothetical protein